MNSYETMSGLVDAGLAKSKVVGDLEIFKYARKVHFDADAWIYKPELRECRGHVYDRVSKKLVQAAPPKSFNHGENGYWKHMPDSAKVAVARKINGFLACVTSHNGELVVSTTGSLDSDFVALAKEHLPMEAFPYSTILDSRTFFFEICDSKRDPHIVKEDDGAHLLGSRCKNTGNIFPMNAIVMTFGEAREMAENAMHEGFMVYDVEDETLNSLCKLKSPYYIGKKTLMRMGTRRVEALYERRIRFNNKWDDIAFSIVKEYPLNTWLAFNEQQRRVAIEHIADGSWSTL